MTRSIVYGRVKNISLLLWIKGANNMLYVTKTIRKGQVRFRSHISAELLNLLHTHLGRHVSCRGMFVFAGNGPQDY